MKKPSRSLMIAFLVWCGIHLLLSIVSLIDGSLFDRIFWAFFPITDGDFYQYTLEEPILYIGLPILIYWVWTKIEEKYYKE